jgi:hypothetical protein
MQVVEGAVKEMHVPPVTRRRYKYCDTAPRTDLSLEVSNGPFVSRRRITTPYSCKAQYNLTNDVIGNDFTARIRQGADG